VAENPRKSNSSQIDLTAEYKALFKKVADITESDLGEIVDLYLAYYDGSNRTQIISDLEEKTEILLLYFEECLVGFTTLQLYDFEWQDSLVQIFIRVIPSCIVHIGGNKRWPSHGSQTLANYCAKDPASLFTGLSFSRATGPTNFYRHSASPFILTGP
jgi:hypothetical protein